MESPGEYLKRERELRSVPLMNIFEATKVPLKYLEALEADDYEILPHSTFVKGYIKAYCKCLGLDENDAVLRYEIYLRERSERPEATHEAPEGRGKPAAANLFSDNSRSIGVLIAVGVLIIIIFYFATSRRKAPVIVPPPASQEAAEQVASKAPAVTDKKPKAIELTTPAGPAKAAKAEPDALKPDAAATGAADKAVTESEAVGKPKGIEATVTSQATKTGKESPIENKAQPSALSAPAAAPKAVKEAGAVKPGAAATDKKHTLGVIATEVVWIKLVIDNGEPFDVVLREGERITWKASEAFSLVVGNAGGVTIAFDGEKLPPLGKSGEVVSLKLPK